ncbi:MAG: carboxylesterase/lipase family protein, partial [Asticcacaulis sp.]|nr:carboxylesterase/lipase family protein [Asticcacaulis sp.]
MSTFVNRRTVLGAGLAATALLFMTGIARAGVPLTTLPGAPFVEVETANGRVRGGTASGALSFKGIPYGGSLSGANRFMRPTPVVPWSGVFDATNLGPPSLQRPGGTYGDHEPPYSEDCLVLNVWTPATDGGKRPVMVYLHGGGFVSGSVGSPTQDGGRLAAAHNVIVVACNHRLGLLGYLFLGEFGEQYAANAGMLDIVQSLRWVKDNIAAFGGDPGNVTVFGESGGGGKVGTLLAMPEAQGLFHKAGIESGAWTRRVTRDRATETARRLLKALDISDAAKLADVPAQALLDLQWQGERGAAPMADPDTTGGRMM